MTGAYTVVNTYIESTISVTGAFCASCVRVDAESMPLELVVDVMVSMNERQADRQACKQTDIRGYLWDENEKAACFPSAPIDHRWLSGVTSREDTKATRAAAADGL